MSIYMLRHRLSDDVITCTYKKKSIPIGFYDTKLAERVSVRVAQDPKHLNCRLKPGKMLPITEESYVYDEDTNNNLRGLRRDLDACLVLHRETSPKDKPNHWQVRTVPDDIFYAYPFSVHSGIVICYDISTENCILPTNAFDKKNISLKSVVLMFDAPSLGQLNRLYKI